MKTDHKVPLITFIPETWLSPYLDNHKYIVAYGNTVGDVFEYLFEAYPECKDRIVNSAGNPHKHLLFFINKQHVLHDQLLETQLDDDDNLCIEAPMAGG